MKSAAPIGFNYFNAGTMKRRISSPMSRRISSSMASLLALAGATVLLAMAATAFTTPSSFGQRTKSTKIFVPTSPQQSSLFQPRTRSSTSLNLLGQDSGILGVGAPEIAVTLLVGYFVLGPSELYKLVKEIGKFIQNFRTLGAEAAKSFEGTMENQLELTELRKAQAELNDAFSFRRSINTDEYGDAFGNTGFAENSAAAAGGAAAAAAGGATATASDGSTVAIEEGTAPKKKRRLVRRKKKKVVEEEEINVPSEEEIAMEYPDLDMLDADLPPSPSASSSDGTSSGISEEDKLRAERLERLSGSASSSEDAAAASEPDWFTASEEEVASAVLDQPTNPALETYEKSRFQSQLSAESWNAQIMANEDKLSPLSMVMQRLAILEDEKNAADKRLEEEYQRRMDNEDKYYLEKRRVLEEAITDIQEGVYGDSNGATAGEKTEKKEKIESVEGPKFTA